MGIARFHIRKTKFVLIGKYRYSKKEKEDLIAQSTTWQKWNIGIWFRKNKIVGWGIPYDPKKWGSGLVNDYMLGIDLLIFQGWINWNTGGMALKVDNLKEKNMKKDVMMYEVVATNLINANVVERGMCEEDLILEIYKETKRLYGHKKVRFLMNVDQDFLSDAISDRKSVG